MTNIREAARKLRAGGSAPDDLVEDLVGKLLHEDPLAALGLVGAAGKITAGVAGSLIAGLGGLAARTHSQKTKAGKEAAALADKLTKSGNIKTAGLAAMAVPLMAIGAHALYKRHEKKKAQKDKEKEQEKMAAQQPAAPSTAATPPQQPAPAAGGSIAPAAGAPAAAPTAGPTTQVIIRPAPAHLYPPPPPPNPEPAPIVQNVGPTMSRPVPVPTPTHPPVYQHPVPGQETPIYPPYSGPPLGAFPRSSGFAGVGAARGQFPQPILQRPMPRPVQMPWYGRR